MKRSAKTLRQNAPPKRSAKDRFVVAGYAARAINCTDDGDTFKFDEGRIVRMFGCKDGWAAGLEAKWYLQKLMERRQIVCHDKGRDRYGR